MLSSDKKRGKRKYLKIVSENSDNKMQGQCPPVTQCVISFRNNLFSKIA